MTKTVKHPALDYSLTFDSTYHTYTDDEGNRYTSGTRIVKAAFPAFDAPATAARVSVKFGSVWCGMTPAAILAAWKAKGAATSDLGHRVHAYAEARILGLEPALAVSDEERLARAAVDAALIDIDRHYEILGAEQIVFCPLNRLAGTIDLPARNRATGATAILDWKINETIDDDGWGRTGLPPVEDIPDSKAAHYALQLSLYAWIMQDSGYIHTDAPVELALIHIPPGATAADWLPLEYLREQVARIVDARWSRRIVPASPAGLTDGDGEGGGPAPGSPEPPDARKGPQNDSGGKPPF